MSTLMLINLHLLPCQVLVNIFSLRLLFNLTQLIVIISNLSVVIAEHAIMIL